MFDTNKKSRPKMNGFSNKSNIDQGKTPNELYD
jgi:hypothetical protein